LSEMLRLAVSALTHKAVSGQEFDLDTLHAALDLAATGDWLWHPTISVYYNGCRALLEPADAARFADLKAAVDLHSENLSITEQRYMYLLCINYCIQQMNRGERTYIREAFDLYKVALSRDLLAESGHITGFTYKNIIRVGTALGEHIWVQDFFEKQRNSLHPREREQLYQYNKAYLFFQKGDYAQAMPMLQQLDLDDRLNLLDARRMLLRSYFELQEWKALESLLGSFGTYLQRQKDLGYHREMYLNLVRFTQKIMDLKQQSRVVPKILADLRNAIEEEKQVAERAWLLEKLG
jgi:tetratricopeptide (TPR) repeat protein